MKDNQQEQLFTELTSEEAAVIEGGAELRLYSIEAIKTGMDSFGSDDVYLKVNGSKEWGTTKMSAGDTKYISKNRIVGDGKTTIDLFDDDPWPRRDDLIATIKVGKTNGYKTVTLKNSKSEYRLTYAIV